MLRGFQVFAISLLTLVFTATVLHSQDVGSHARMVRISYLEGTVQINSNPATMNTPIREGDALRTGTDGLAEVQFEDGSAIRMASETQITFAQLARLTSGEAITRTDLDEGEGEFLIPASSAGQFAVNAHGKNLMFKAAGRYRILNTASNPLEIAVWKGEVIVRDRESGKEVTVKKNETFTLNPSDPGQYDLENALVADDLDEWSNMRDQSLSAAASTYSYSNQGAYTSPAGLYPSSYDTYLYGGAYNCYGFGWFPGNCWNSPFFYPWSFFPPTNIVVVPQFPIGIPHRPPHPRPPTVPLVATTVAPGPVVARPGPPPRLRAGIAEVEAVPVKPGVRSFRFDQGVQRVFNEDNFQRTTSRAESPVSSEAVKPVEPTQAAEPLVAPGHHSVGNGSTGTRLQPTVATAPTSSNAPSHPAPQHSAPSAPSAPSRPSSPPASSSGSHGFSGSGSHSSSSSSSSHSGGGGGRH